MYNSLEDIKEDVERSEGVLTLRVETIRDAYNVRRMGKHVSANISKGLKSLGLTHYPEEIPQSQDSQVRIYKQGTPMAELLQAAINPSESGDEVLRSKVAGDAESILDDIRNLVCQ